MSWTGIFLQATLMLSGMTDMSDSNVCVDYYSPVEGTAIRSVEGYEGNWSTHDELCRDTHFSYNLIQRSAIWKDPRLGWNDSLCAQESGTVLPLRMRKSVNRTVYWINDFDVDDEELTKEELELIDPDALIGLNTFGGFVHDPTFGMTFVSRDHKFTCSLCEILRRKSLKTPIGPPPPPPGTNVEYWVHIHAISASPVDTVRRDLAAALNIPVLTVEHIYTQHSQETLGTTSSATSLQTITTTLTTTPTPRPTTTATTTVATTTPTTRPTTTATTTAATTTAATTTVATTTVATTTAATTEATSVISIPYENSTFQSRMPNTAPSNSGTPPENTNGTTEPLGAEDNEENGDEEENVKPAQQNSRIKPDYRNRNKTFTSSANLSTVLQSMSIEETGNNAVISSSEEEAASSTETSTTTVSTTTPTSTSTDYTDTTADTGTSTDSMDTTQDTGTSTDSTDNTPDTSTSTTTTANPTGGSSTTLEPDIEVQVYQIKLTNADPLLPQANKVTTPVYFNVTSIDGNHYCVGETAVDAFGNRHSWPDTKPGVVVVKRNNKDGRITLTSRECTYTAVEYIARWTESTVWNETWKDCSSPIDPNEDDKERLEDASNYLSDLTDVPVLSRQLNDIAEVVNEVLNLDEDVLTSNDESTTKIVKDLETIFSNMMIETGDVVNATQSNLAFVVSDVQSSSDTVVGVSISTGSSNELVLQLVRSSVQLSFTNQTQVQTVLPYEVVRRHTRLAFMIFPDGTLFPSGQGSKYKTNSHVINIIMVNGNISTHALEGEYIEISFNPLVDVHARKACGYWNFTENNWETSGCYLMNNSNNHMDVCRCTHLTNFAEIITGGSSVTGANARALEIISLVGCTFSMSALLAIALTAILFEHWRRELSNKILLNMSAAIALNLVAFFLVASVRTQPDSAVCIVIGVILHYSVLTCFFWMLVMSTLQLLRLVTIMGAKSIPNLLLKTTLFAWGVPLLPIIVSLSIDPHIYTTSSGTPLERDFCYPKGAALYVTVMAPVAVVVTTNLVVFVVIMFRIHSWCGWGKLETLERHGLTDRDIAMRRFSTTVLLFFLFGLTSIFGLFAYNIVFAYLFCITATMQGFVLFVFLVLLEQKTSGYWKTAISKISNKNRSSELSHSGSKISETSFRSLPFYK